MASYLNRDERRLASLRCLVASFQAQTYGNWKMLICHDGPVSSPEAEAVLRGLEADKRVVVLRTTKRKENHGHPHRQMVVLDLIKHNLCQWIGLTNDDNYYAPTYLEWMLSAGEKARFVYCDMVHSHKLWKPMATKPRYKHLDLGAFLVRADVAVKVPFDNFSFNGDGDWINRLVAASGNHVVKVPATLMVHN